MNNFSFARYRMLLKCYLVENRRHLLTLMAVMWGVMILVSVQLGLSYTEYNYGSIFYYRQARLENLCGIMTLLMTVFACMSGSIMFSSLKKREGRIRVLMRPASMAEKFAVCFTVYMVLFTVAWFAGWAIADGCHAAASGLPPTWAFDGEIIKKRDAAFFLMSIIMMQSVFALGSALWPKRSFTKTFLCLFVLMLLSMFTRLPHTVNTHTAIPGSVVMAALTVLFYALAWLRFRNVQITQRFMN